jgi:hypothetical protein
MTESAVHHVSLIGAVFASAIVVFSVCLAACINAMFLRLLTRLVCRIALPFRAAFRLSVILILLVCPVGIAGAIIVRPVKDAAVYISLALWIANIAISSFIYGRVIKKSDHETIGMQKGAVIAVSMAIIQFGVSVLYVWLKHLGTRG